MVIPGQAKEEKAHPESQIEKKSMLKMFNIILTCIFVGVGIFSFSKVISLYKDNKSLNQQINDVFKPKVAKLESENTKINEELGKVQNSLLASEEANRVLKDELVLRKEDLKKAQELLEEKEKTLTELTNRNNDLSNENNLYKDKFDAMLMEFTDMKQTLSSIDALKQAIKELKANAKKNKRRAKTLPKTTEINKKDSQKQQISQDQDVETYGNQGYLVRDGKSTYVPRVIIKVLNVEE